MKKVFTKPASFEREVSALRSARMHPNIVQLKDVLDIPEADTWLLVTELLEGGELFERIVNKGIFSERNAAVVIRKVASALQCLHTLGWAHNDIKPENIMYISKAPDSDIKIVDFGMARRIDENENEKEGSGTRDLGTTVYWSPEMLDPKKRMKADPRAIDAWTIGVLMYILLYACHPFDRSGDDSEDVVARRIANGSAEGSYLKFEVPGLNREISNHAKDLITGLLNPDPAERLSIDDILIHPWIAHSARLDDDEEADIEYAKSIPSKLKGERDARAALLKLLNLATESSAAHDSFFNPKKPLEGSGNSSEDYSKEKIVDDKYLQTFDDIVYDFGDPTNGLYILVKGRAVVEYPSATDKNSLVAVQTIVPGELFGEPAILEGRNTRNARVRASDGPIQAYCFSRDDVVAVLSSNEDLKERMDELSARRYRIRAANALFRRKSELGKTIFFKPGEQIFVQGTPSETLYFIKSGVVKSIVNAEEITNDSEEKSPATALEIALGNKSGRVVLAEWGPGDIFGISALYGSPRFATAVAQTPVYVTEIKRSELEEVLETEPGLRENLAKQFRIFKERSFLIPRKLMKKEQDKILDLKKGEILFHKNDDSNEVYYVQSGTVELVDDEGKVIYENFEGMTFGTEAFATDIQRRYTARVASENAKIITCRVGENR